MLEEQACRYGKYGRPRAEGVHGVPKILGVMSVEICGSRLVF
jgi:hypothetical protein